MAPKRKTTAMAKASNVLAKGGQSKRATKKQKTESNDEHESEVVVVEAERVTTEQDGIEQGGDDGSAKFTLFPKLPLELRNKIWGFAAPEPCVVVQCESFHTNIRFRYVRDGCKVPSVLHACRESRAEFLEKSDRTVDDSLERRRREHPVYKLSFIDQGRSHRNNRLVFFSSTQDSFWGQCYGMGRHIHDTMSGVGRLDIAPELKHLVWKGNPVLKDLVKNFPKLESVTVLLGDERAPVNNIRSTKRVKVVMGPEVNGELDATALSPDDLFYVNRFRGYTQRSINQLELDHPGIVPPIFKWRFEKQFLENEGIELPARPEDDFSDTDSE